MSLLRLPNAWHVGFSKTVASRLRGSGRRKREPGNGSPDFPKFLHRRAGLPCVCFSEFHARRKTQPNKTRRSADGAPARGNPVKTRTQKREINLKKGEDFHVEIHVVP